MSLIANNETAISAWVAPQVSKTHQVGPEVGPTSAFYSCILTGMHGPTGIVWANLTPFWPQRAESVGVGLFSEGGGAVVCRSPKTTLHSVFLRLSYYHFKNSHPTGGGGRRRVAAGDPRAHRDEA